MVLALLKLIQSITKDSLKKGCMMGKENSKLDMISRMRVYLKMGNTKVMVIFKKVKVTILGILKMEFSMVKEF